MFGMMLLYLMRIFRHGQMDQFVLNYFSKHKEAILPVRVMKPVAKETFLMIRRILLRRFLNIMEVIMLNG